VKITRTSPFSGEDNTMEINVTLEQLDAWHNGTALIQDAFPWLTVDEREFIMTGLLPDEWDRLYGNNY